MTVLTKEIKDSTINMFKIIYEAKLHVLSFSSGEIYDITPSPKVKKSMRMINVATREDKVSSPVKATKLPRLGCLNKTKISS